MKIVMLWFTLFLSHFLYAKEKVTAYTYYDFQPFVIDTKQQTGLIYDFASLLSKLSHGKYHFSVRYIPRKRLDKHLMTGNYEIVIFAYPLWFGDGEKIKYLWSDPIIPDENAIISHKSKPFEFESMESFRGVSIIGILGHRFFSDKDYKYYDINVIAEAPNWPAAIKMVNSNRADIGIMSMASTKYLLKEMNVPNIYLSKKPPYTFGHCIFTNPQLKKLHQFILDVTKNIKENNEWNKILKKYHLSS
ncbi:substrate-binding periplasmic protein [Spartinivicinus poritis]|uniref:Transporter substrate-binding domain-containing protein n=1 Tax=Spartinivicinus poritis TaxID=2994640 RepID=A0ABT5U1U6_9GAMM|nr:transporter substrate-binding domain-containing protein [Spartinivicinus sp. A2-2]MDE1460346.1 transporter substrate-binding domain-containing protein [Spartinivicinus sp. A2-2]